MMLPRFFIVEVSGDVSAYSSAEDAESAVESEHVEPGLRLVARSEARDREE
jgi:hypothetical protein